MLAFIVALGVVCRGFVGLVVNTIRDAFRVGVVVQPDNIDAGTLQHI
jgi:hypothetical protein